MFKNDDWKKDIKWDVTHEDALRMTKERTFFFDPELSYETTGYRPITKDKGLDFDPMWFNNAGRTRIATGKYTDYPAGSRLHREWWLEQHRRCNEGYSVNGYHITGDNYFFLNFYMMLIVEEGRKAGQGRNDAHPRMIIVQYEWFHYVELCEVLGYDAACLKSRGVGWSEIAASMSVRPYTTVPNYTVMIVAQLEKYVGTTLAKCWKQLDFLNQNTEGGMRRVRQAIDHNFHKQASKKNKQGEVSGHMSQVLGQVIDKPDKLRGDRTERLIFEETGSNNVFEKSYAVGEPLVVVNGIRLGIRISFGTGGDAGPALEGLENIFLRPKAYSVLPYKHTHNRSRSPVLTAFFVPAWRTVIQALDHRGVADEAIGKAFYQQQRDDKMDTPTNFIKHCSEYCWIYEEALSQKGQNNFNQDLIAEQRIKVDVEKVTPKPRVGFLEWNIERSTGERLGVKFTEHPRGDIEVMEEPIRNPDGTAIPNLYVAGIDSIDGGTEETAVGEDGSKFCIVVKKRTFGMEGGNEYVCKYLKRPKKITEAYDTAMLILLWYGCKANLEDTKIGIKGHFRDKNMIHLLMKRPQLALQTQYSNKTAASLYGTQASVKMIEYGLELVAGYVEEHCHKIYFSDMLEQLQDYSYEAKKKFDIIAAMQMAEIGDQEIRLPARVEEKKEEWVDVGFYFDERGIKRYGPIPRRSNNTDLYKMDEDF